MLALLSHIVCQINCLICPKPFHSVLIIHPLFVSFFYLHMLQVRFPIQLAREEILVVFFHAYSFEHWGVLRSYQTRSGSNLSWKFGAEKHGNRDPLFCTIYSCPMLNASIHPIAHNLQIKKRGSLLCSQKREANSSKRIRRGKPPGCLPH